MPKVILTDARIKALRPRRTAYDIRDGKLKGYGVRVLVSRLLGHSDVRTTLRYAHLGDREIEAAAERVGQSIAALLRI